MQALLDNNYRKDLSEPNNPLIVCKHGTIGKWSDTEIVLAVDGRQSCKALRAKLQGIGKLYNDGDDGQNWIYPSRYLGRACRIMGARRS